MAHEIQHILVHSLEHTLALVPFLFLTYLAMEFLEHKTGEKTYAVIKKAGKFGPFIGGVLGAVPQCGFSAAASSLYAGKVITLGTLIAIYLSTSDEMLPIMLSSDKATPEFIGMAVGIKVIIGIVAGVMIDLLYKNKKEEHEHIHEICEHEHCGCEKGVIRSSVVHTLQITFFIFLITVALNFVMHLGGEAVLENLILNHPIAGPMIAGLVGFIPNCASSVVITQLYLEGAMGLGAMMSGLLVGAGVGLLVLFRVNPNKVENFKIMGLLYAIGVVSGIVIDLMM